MRTRDRITQRREARGKISLLPRWTHRTYAFAAGYFWLPCTLCGRKRGGHEVRYVDGKDYTIASDRTGIMRNICPVCTYEGRGNQLSHT